MIKLEKTADGSYTLFVPEMDEHYHSIKGALTESEHIFINMGLKHTTITEPHILEIGFGTGLNAFLTLLEAEGNQRKIHYTTLEKYPLNAEVLLQLNYPEIIAPEAAELYYKMHHVVWNVPVAITPYFTLQKIETDYTTFSFQQKYDIIYFDAFAPEKQPEIIRILFNRFRAAVCAPAVDVLIIDLPDCHHLKIPLANLRSLYYHNRKECRHFHPADGSGAFQKIRRIRQVHPH